MPTELIDPPEVVGIAEIPTNSLTRHDPQAPSLPPSTQKGISGNAAETGHDHASGQARDATCRFAARAGSAAPLAGPCLDYLAPLCPIVFVAHGVDATLYMGLALMAVAAANHGFARTGSDHAPPPDHVPTPTPGSAPRLGEGAPSQSTGRASSVEARVWARTYGRGRLTVGQPSVEEMGSQTISDGGLNRRVSRGWLCKKRFSGE